MHSDFWTRSPGKLTVAPDRPSLRSITCCNGPDSATTLITIVLAFAQGQALSAAGSWHFLSRRVAQSLGVGLGEMGRHRFGAAL